MTPDVLEALEAVEKYGDHLYPTGGDRAHLVKAAVVLAAAFKESQALLARMTAACEKNRDENTALHVTLKSACDRIDELEARLPTLYTKGQYEALRADNKTLAKKLAAANQYLAGCAAKGCALCSREGK